MLLLFCKKSRIKFTWRRSKHHNLSIASVHSKSKRPKSKPPGEFKNAKSFIGRPVFTGKSYWNDIICKQLRLSHSIVFPQFLVNFSGFGAPMIDYFHYSIIPASAIIFSICYPAICWFGSTQIMDLSVEKSKNTIFIRTCTNAIHSIPVNQCSITGTILKVGQENFYFYRMGSFDTKNLSFLKQILANSDGSSSSKVDFTVNKMDGMFTKEYFACMIATCFVLLGLFLFTGYSDLLYFMSLLAMVQENLFGANFFKNRFGHIIL